MRAITVSSIFANLEKLALELAPRSGQALLGARWSFVLPSPEHSSRLTEYSLPLGRVSFAETLARRTGIQIAAHEAAESDGLYRHLARGAPAIAVVDSFHLPYRPAFGRVHSHRTLIVRGCDRAGQVWLEDVWPPGFEGYICADILERSRHSEVPLDPQREPIFAGHPIDGEWWSLELLPGSIEDPVEWAGGILGELWAEASAPGADSGGQYGLDAWTAFRSRLERALSAPPAKRFTNLRGASLLLRAELSSRVYLCAFLRAAARWTKGLFPLPEAVGYYTDLRHLEMARDLITKSLTHCRAEYTACILTHLTTAIDADRRLASCLAEFAGQRAYRLLV